MSRWLRSKNSKKKDFFIIIFLVIFMTGMVLGSYYALKLFAEGAKNQANLVIPLQSEYIAGINTKTPLFINNEKVNTLLFAENSDSIAIGWNEESGFEYEVFSKEAGAIINRGVISNEKLIRLKNDGEVIFAVTDKSAYRLGEASVEAVATIDIKYDISSGIDIYCGEDFVSFAYTINGSLYLYGVNGARLLADSDEYDYTFANPRFVSSGSRVVCDIYENPIMDEYYGLSITDFDTGETKIYFPSDIVPKAKNIANVGFSAGNRMIVETTDENTEGLNTIRVITEIDVKTMEIINSRDLTEYLGGNAVQSGIAVIEARYTEREIDNEGDKITVPVLALAVTNTNSGLKYSNYAWILYASKPYFIFTDLTGNALILSNTDDGYKIFYIPVVFR